MRRPVLTLWRYLVPAVLPVPALLMVRLLADPWARLAPVATVLVVIGLVRARWAWRLALHVRRVHTLDANRVILHYDPALADRCDLPTLAGQFAADLDRLAAWFGGPLRGRSAVYLFADAAPIARLFGPEYGGTALPAATAVLVTIDRVRETVRHELAHLFAARWNPYAPPLLAEGLAVWLQGTDQGEPIDAAAWPWVNEPALGLRALLSPSFFFADPHRHACYVLAGSFTGFLIRRHGRATHRRLYQWVTARGFERDFEDAVGVSLGAAERAWRQEVRAAGPLGGLAAVAEPPLAAEPVAAPDTGRDNGYAGSS
jgi:hypothetical protein